MKIAIVLNTSWNIYNFRKGLVEALLNEGHEIFALAPKDNYSEKLVELGCKFIPIKMDSRGANPIKDFSLIFELFYHYRRIDPDIILHYTIKPNIYGTIAGALLRKPIVNNVCGLGTIFLKDGLVSKIAILMYKIAFRFPKRIFFQNPDDAALFQDRKLVKKEVCDLVPGSGLNLKHFSPIKKVDAGKSFTFLLISRLIYDKGIVEYIKAVEQLKLRGVDANFQILGALDEQHKRGIPKKLLDGWVDKGTIDYLGNTDDVKQFIREADCIVLPSYREGTPRTLLEAAGMAKPLIATNVPGCRNVVQDQQNGYLCELKNPDDLANKMEQMCSLDSKKLENMGEFSRKYVSEHFSEDIVIRKYQQTIKELL